MSSGDRQVSYAALVGAVVARRRRALGLNQTALAQAAAINQAGWSKIERGALSMSVEHLTLVAPLLGVRPGLILDEAERLAEHAESLGVLVVRRRLESGGLAPAVVAAWAAEVLASSPAP